MNKEILKAINSIMNKYDAYYFRNKYSDESNTHKKEFELLIKYFKNDKIGLKAIKWIKDKYDCHYKNEFNNDRNSAFSYLKNKLGE